MIEKWNKVVKDRDLFGALLTDLSKSSMREKCQNMEFFRPVFSCIATRGNLVFGHFSQSALTAIRMSLLLPNYTLPKKCLYSEFFSSVFSCIRTEYGEKRSISPYSVWMWKSTDQKNSEYGHFTQWQRYGFHIDTLKLIHDYLLNRK